MHWRFGRFQLDCASACLWEEEQRLTLRPKTFDFLVYLVAHAGELVRKETLLQAVWPDTVVADGVLTTSMGELRKVLGETAKQPQFIATVHRRGYRFIAPVTPSEPAPSPSTLPSLPSPPSRRHCVGAAQLPPRPLCLWTGRPSLPGCTSGFKVLATGNATWSL